jgi:predicted ester cyclase
MVPGKTVGEGRGMLHVFAAGVLSASCPDLSFNVTALIIIAQVIIARRYFPRNRRGYAAGRAETVRMAA